MYDVPVTDRSPVKEWQVSWFDLGKITLNGTDTTVKRLDRNVGISGELVQSAV